MNIAPHSSKLACDFCGYDLRGVSGVCPECGRPTYRFTDRAREVVTLANGRAIDLLARASGPSSWWRHLLPQTPPVIKPRHILLAIATGPHGIGYHALLSCGVEPHQLAARIERRGTWGARLTFRDGARLPLSPSAHALVRIAVEEAFEMKQDWVGTEHLLLAMTKSIDGVARNALLSLDVTHEAIMRFIRQNAQAIAQASTAADQAGHTFATDTQTTSNTL